MAFNPLGPGDDFYERLLDDRARRLSEPLRGRDTGGDDRLVLVARAGRERIGLPCSGLDGAFLLDPVVPLPGAPRFHLGLAARRGEVLSVVDLAAWLGAGEVESPAGLCVIVRGRAGRAALRVSAIEELRNMPRTPAASAPPTAPAVTELERARTIAVTDDFVRVVDLDSILEHPDFRSGAQGGGGDTR